MYNFKLYIYIDIHQLFVYIEFNIKTVVDQSSRRFK